MTGIKGRSGKVTTSAQREARRLAAQSGGFAKRERSAGEPSSEPAGDDLPERIRPPFPVQNWMDLKDAKAVELTDVKIDTAKVELESARELAATKRGKLLTIDQVRDRESARTELILGKIGQLVDAAVSQVPPEQQPIMRHQMELSVTQFRKDIAIAIRGA